MKNRLIKIILIFSSLIYFSGCVSFRSAEGLNGGEVNISYIAPIAGALRVGLTDNIETRAMIIGKAFRTDIFVHTKNDSGKFNFGLTFGAEYFNKIRPNYFLGLTTSLNESNFSPYISFFVFRDDEDKDLKNFNKNSYFKILSFGSEILIYKSKKSLNKIIITPEVAMSFPAIGGGGAWINSNLFGCISIGYTFSTLNIF